MHVLSVKQEARLHREVYVATLRSALKAWGRHRDFAVRIGRTREYLEYLLREDGIRVPGPETVKRIADCLPLPAQQREELQQHMLQSAERRVRARRAAHHVVAAISTTETLERMRAAHWAATYADEPEEVRAQYRLLYDLAKALVQQEGMRRLPLVLIETCLLLHDVESVLDRPGDALYHARLAGSVVRGLDPGNYRQSRDRFDHLALNVPYAEAVTLTTLGLQRQATDRLQYAQVNAGLRATAATFWLPHLYRHRLATLAGQARFSLYQAEEWAKLARTACERRDDPLDPQVSLLIDVSLARIYLRYGSRLALRKASRLLRPGVETLPQAPYLGPVHRLSVLTTFARICWREQRSDEWAHYTREALALATAAGLQHQVRKIWDEYGEALAPLCDAMILPIPDEKDVGLLTTSYDA